MRSKRLSAVDPEIRDIPKHWPQHAPDPTASRIWKRLAFSAVVVLVLLISSALRAELPLTHTHGQAQSHRDSVGAELRTHPAAIEYDRLISALKADNDVVVLAETSGLQAHAKALHPGCVEVSAAQLLCDADGKKAAYSSDPKTRAAALQALSSQGLLIIPASAEGRLMAFDPISGDLLDPDFVVLDEDATGTAIHALPLPDGRILVSDQTRDVVHAYSAEGAYLGVFAPAGGVNTAIMDNVRGMALRPNGNLLVASAAGSNAHAIVEFDAGGNHVGNFVANGSGGLNSPFGILARPGTDWLVSSVNNSRILRYAEGNGASLDEFAQISSFPQQMVQLDNGNVLLANFSGSTLGGIVELSAAGAVLDAYTAPGIGGFRGVYPLPNGNLLTSGSSGVHEIDRDGNLVSSKHIGGTRFIEFLPPPFGIVLHIGVGLEPELPDASFCPTDKHITAPIGTQIRWCYRLTNNTDITLTRHDLESSQFGPVLENLELSLAPGASEFVWQTAAVTQAVVESAQWDAYNPGPQDTFSASDSASVSVPVDIFADGFEDQD